MSAPLCNTFLLLSSALNITEETMDAKKQGIVSILRSDSDIPTKATSLRRTLPADMSSHKWLTQQGLVSPLKKSPSSKEFDVSSSLEEGEDDTEASSQFDIWASIQQKKEVENRGQLDMWISIVSQKAEEETLKSSPPYIHPLVKRSASCLSEKSLEICTESLGSETGSDGFSSETGEMEEDKQEDQQQQLLHQKQERVVPTIMPCFDGEKTRIAKYNYDVGKKSPNTSFPPPIPSLSAKDGASRRLKTRRDNGRLVVEAVSMPALNNFLAQRHDGRLVLTFANTTAINDAEDVMEIEELEKEFESFGEKESEVDIEEEEEEKESEDMCCEIEQAPKLSSGAINVHRLAVMMNKPIWLANRNPTWPKLKFGDEREARIEPTTPPPPLAQPLPPRPPSKVVAAAGAGGSFNAYEYYWRRPNQGMEDNSKKQVILSRNVMGNKEGKMKGEYLVPMLKGCKEARRSILFWEPHCIATS